MAKTKNPLLEVIRMVFPKKPSLAILQYGMVQNHYMVVTDLDRRMEIKVENDVGDGMYYLPILIASKGDWEAAKQAAGGMKSDDFPNAPKTETGDRAYNIPVPVLFENGVEDVGVAVYNDPTHPALKHIHFNAVTGMVEATDGHVLLRQKLETPFKTSMLIKPVDLALIHVLSQIETPDKVTVFERKDKENQIMQRRLSLLCKSWSLSVRLSEDTYPDVTKVLPKHDKEQQVTWSEGQIHMTIQALKAFAPFVPRNSELVMFDEKCFYSVNPETQICKRWGYADSICVLPVVDIYETVNDIQGKTGERLLERKGVNTTKLLQVLLFIGTSAVFNAGRTAHDAMVFRNDTSGRYALVMPWRLVDGFHTDKKYTDLKVLP